MEGPVPTGSLQTLCMPLCLDGDGSGGAGEGDADPTFTLSFLTQEFPLDEWEPPAITRKASQSIR